MDKPAALLRVLTKKSRLGFGKHADMTVADVIACHKSYISWLYYNMAGITFCEEILDEFEFVRIAKPGTSRDAEREWRKNQSAKYSDEERTHYNFRKSQIKRKVAKGRLAIAIGQETLTKGQLQAINHGHGIRRK